MDEILKTLIIDMAVGFGSGEEPPVGMEEAVARAVDYHETHLRDSEAEAIATGMESLRRGWALISAGDRKALYARGVEHFGGLLAARMRRLQSQ